MFSFIKILLIATFIVVVSSKPLDNTKSSQQARPVVFGQDVEGAFQIVQSLIATSSDKTQPEIVFDFLYPDTFPNFKIPNLTKIVVSLSEIDDGATFDVKVKEGGIGKDHVYLQVVAKNSKALAATVKYYGVNEIIESP